jgi:hypothetical protein
MRQRSRRKVLAGVAMAVAVVSLPVAGRCDDAATVLPWQIADALTTRLVLSRPCGYERDPLARGVVRSDLGAVAGAVVTNLVMRKFVRRHSAFRIAIGTEATLVASNLANYERTGAGMRAGRVCR